MSNINGVNFKKGKVGTNRLGSDDSISGMVLTGPKPTNLTFSTPKAVYNIEDVESLGITKEYDSTNNVHVYEHLSEFFRFAPIGTECYLILEEQTKKLVDLCDESAKKLLLFAEGKIKQIAIGLNLPEAATVTMLNGLPDDVYNSIAKAKVLEEWSELNFMPVSVFLEGYAYGGSAASSADLRDIENLSAEGVTLVIGQDYDVASKKTGHAQKYANIGTVLGVCASCSVNQNIGENETKNLTNGPKKLLVNPGLSNHKLTKEQYSDLQTLENKGYVFGLTYTGLAGVRFNNDHVCAPIILDDENNINEHTVAYGRTAKKVRRLLRTIYLPKVKTDPAVNPETGKLLPGVVVALEALGDSVFADMQRAGEISGGKTYVDPNSDVIVAKVLTIGFKVVPKGNVGEINGTVNLKTQL
ncbi:Uncharacterised protein [Chryseobacterium nakagawai]|uniref:Tail sheath protein n=1 Tax=Chryseobacterium nakagawai TaxID=1241982 RepID=A0AAD0YNA0_CHRNA|nr:DUF2586 family protein [Chryseobacterium nakagawai]AZA90923.1 hypothetical protein EG343_09890 [Chryseobacterium nakagawai]VEH22461.1 Uncharacterised protein [Chryseobacterium nakagawai]